MSEEAKLRLVYTAGEKDEPINSIPALKDLQTLLYAMENLDAFIEHHLANQK